MIINSYSLLLYLQNLKPTVFQAQISLKINLNYLFFPSELNVLQLLLISCTWGHTAAAISLFVFIFIHSENKRSEKRKSSTEGWN